MTEAIDWVNRWQMMLGGQIFKKARRQRALRKARRQKILEKAKLRQIKEKAERLKGGSWLEKWNSMQEGKHLKK